MQVKALDYISIFENKMPIIHETIIRKKIIAAHGEGLISCKIVYHGSNSWMMLSNRMTANNLELNPTSQASDKMKNVSKLCHAPVRHIFERMSFFTPASAMTVCTSFRHVKVSANQRLASARSRSANRSSAEHWCNIQKILIKCFCLFSYGFFEKRDL